MAQLRVPRVPDLPVPAEPESFVRMRGLAESLLENPVAHAILDLLPGYALILTQDRRVLAGDRDVLAELGLTTPESLEGLRAGELFRCVPERDGFSRSRQFWVRSAPLRIGGHDLLLFLFKETSEQKRREALEEVFLHDLLNLVGGLTGIAGRLQDRQGDPEAIAGQIRELSGQLVDEIKSQRLLLGAGEGCLAGESREVGPPRSWTVWAGSSAPARPPKAGGWSSGPDRRSRSCATRCC